MQATISGTAIPSEPVVEIVALFIGRKIGVVQTERMCCILATVEAYVPLRHHRASSGINAENGRPRTKSPADRSASSGRRSACAHLVSLIDP